MRRTWGVAMDNAVAIPGYKQYLDADGAAPGVCVAFLDLAPAPGAELVGAVLAVDDAALAALDVRERNYTRVDVTAIVDAGAAAGTTVWTYFGRDDARERARRAAEAGTLVVQRGYLETVRAAFWSLGVDALARFDASTAPPPGRIADLRRVDLPG
jgi:hypothetical protein